MSPSMIVSAWSCVAKRDAHALRTTVHSSGSANATLLAPQGRRVSVHPRHGASVCSHRYSPPPPSTHSKRTRCLNNDVGREGGLLLDGVASPPATMADADYFDRLRVRVRDTGRR